MQGLEKLLGTKGRITILRKLCEHPERDFSISELSDETGVDKSLVSRVIAELAKEYVVSARERRNLKLCQINTSNGAYKLLSDIFSSEKKLNGPAGIRKKPARKVRFPWSA